MATRSFAETLGQVRLALGLRESQTAKLGKQIGDLELSDPEVERVVDAVNVTLRSIYAERHIAETMHRVPHKPKVIDELVDTWDQEHPSLKTKPKDGKPGKALVRHSRNELEACPDCTRPLVAARDVDAARIAVLVCNRLHGLSLGAVTGLTPGDVVACGIEE